MTPEWFHPMRFTSVSLLCSGRGSWRVTASPLRHTGSWIGQVLSRHGSKQRTSNSKPRSERSWVLEKQSCCLWGCSGTSGLVTMNTPHVEPGFHSPGLGALPRRLGVTKRVTDRAKSSPKTVTPVTEVKPSRAAPVRCASSLAAADNSTADALELA